LKRRETRHSFTRAPEAVGCSKGAIIAAALLLTRLRIPTKAATYSNLIAATIPI
jgi:hypothetical protein